MGTDGCVELLAEEGEGHCCEEVVGRAMDGIE